MKGSYSAVWYRYRPDVSLVVRLSGVFFVLKTNPAGVVHSPESRATCKDAATTVEHCLLLPANSKIFWPTSGAPVSLNLRRKDLLGPVTRVKKKKKKKSSRSAHRFHSES